MSTQHRFPTALLVALLPLAPAGCGTIGGGETALQGNAIAAEITGEASVCEHQWLLESLSVDGREHRSRLLWQKLWRDRPYLTCDKLGYVRGSAGSNPYLGRFSVDRGGELSWPQVPEVSRMNGAEDSSELERKYLKALPQTDSMKLEGDSLILQGGSGATRLEFKRAEGGPD